MEKYIYLAGPISGQKKADAEDWRSVVSSKVASDIVCLSPLRDRTDFSSISHHRTPESTRTDLLHGIQIVARDRMDIMRCDLVLVNVLNHESISIGTVGEIFWADAFRKPVIIIKNISSVYNHSMLDALCQWRFSTIEEGVDKINILLSNKK
ncbi:nucleoside 2-deoxyribosyltransferase [Parachryseolinea silvisoli]|uniref:nucleoside 2-deoxyribosyltransferase n=1 Tax=Parachryseolinea silvisoli TaxID=2873601 RepID=UPI0022658EAD|nr:nucleoside 2-deoxyribosyltransferase [Parachryseolinea silvisoli]MCD9019146.1 nucleoside 2-deoxyribosyltransferase [Parachryseolinea silvisoli]